MSKTTTQPPIHVDFGNQSTQWSPALRSNALIFIFIAPVFCLSALTGFKHPLALFSFGTHPLQTAIGILALVIILAIQLSGYLLLRSNRALGVIVTTMGALYFSPMVAVLAVAAVAMNSLWMTLISAVLVTRSLYLVTRAEKQREPDAVQRIANERVVQDSSGLLLLPGTAIENGGLLVQEQVRVEGSSVLIRGLLVLGTMIGAAVFLPQSGTHLSSQHITASIVWVLLIGVISVTRRPISSFVLLWRAMCYARAHFPSTAGIAAKK